MSVWCNDIAHRLPKNMSMWEQLTTQLDFSNMYALLSYLLYWHKPLRFNSWKMLLCSSGECNKASMSIIICFVLSKFVIGSVLWWSVESSLYKSSCGETVCF